MTDRNAPPALCLFAPRAAALGTDDPDALQNRDTTDLPNGALCWVNDTATLYRLDKLSVLAADDSVVIPAASGGGNWLALAGDLSLMSAGRMSMFSAAEPTLTVGGGNVNTWLALPVDEAGPYGPQVVGAAFWTIDTDTGIATYSGPPQVYHFTASLNAAVDAEVTTEVQLALTINGEDIGTTNARGLQQRGTPFDADHFQVISLANEFSIDPADTVQLIVRNATSSDNLILAGIQIIGIPVGPQPEIIIL